MLDGIKNLINSEKAIAAGVLALISGVLVLKGDMTVDQWTEYSKWLLVIYVGGKTVQGAVSAVAEAKVQTAAHDAQAAVVEAQANDTLFEKFRPYIEQMMAGMAKNDAADAAVVSAAGVDEERLAAFERYKAGLPPEPGSAPPAGAP